MNSIPPKTRQPAVLRLVHEEEVKHRAEARLAAIAKADREEDERIAIAAHNTRSSLLIAYRLRQAGIDRTDTGAVTEAVAALFDEIDTASRVELAELLDAAQAAMRTLVESGAC